MHGDGGGAVVGVALTTTADECGDSMTLVSGHSSLFSSISSHLAPNPSPSPLPLPPLPLPLPLAPKDLHYISPLAQWGGWTKVSLQWGRGRGCRHGCLWCGRGCRQGCLWCGRGCRHGCLWCGRGCRQGCLWVSLLWCGRGCRQGCLWVSLQWGRVLL